jgi:hypothetical protein
MAESFFQRRRPDDSEIARIAAEIAELENLAVSELAERWQDLFGEAPRSRNKAWLRKRIAYRMQEIAFGGLSPAALARIDELAEKAPIRRRGGRLLSAFTNGEPERREKPVGPQRRVAAEPTVPSDRDERFSPEGFILTREHRGETHEVEVLEDGFEYDGRPYRTLSEVARAITGAKWNGYTFFGLKGPWSDA